MKLKIFMFVSFYVDLEEKLCYNDNIFLRNKVNDKNTLYLTNGNMSSS